MDASWDAGVVSDEGREASKPISLIASHTVWRVRTRGSYVRYAALSGSETEREWMPVRSCNVCSMLSVHDLHVMPSMRTVPETDIYTKRVRNRP